MSLMTSAARFFLDQVSGQSIAEIRREFAPHFRDPGDLGGRGWAAPQDVIWILDSQAAMDALNRLLRDDSVLYGFVRDTIGHCRSTGVFGMSGHSVLPVDCTVADVVYSIGNHLEPDNLEYAAICFLIAMLSDPAQYHFLSCFGLSMARLGYTDIVYDLFRDALQRDRNDNQLALAYGKCLLEMGDFEEAEVAFHEVLQEDPENPTCWYCLGLVYSETGDLHEAEDAYGRYVILRPDDVVGTFNYASVLIRTGQKQKAFELLKRAHRIDPNDSSVLRNLELLSKEKGLAAGPC